MAGIYAAARLVTTAFFGLVAISAEVGSRFGPDATLLDFVQGWDSAWYFRVAVDGYPSELPVDANGVVQENQWAFLPVFPYLSRMLDSVVPGSWGVAALVVSLAAGLGACLIYFHLLRRHVDERASLWGVAFLACAPLSPLFQVGYAEALALLLLFVALWCLIARSYWWLWLVIPALGYTRPGVLAFALTCLVLVALRWRSTGRRDRIHLLGLTAWASAVGWSWPVIAGIVTGQRDAYFQTEVAWRRAFTGEQAFVPFKGWADGVEFWFGYAWARPEWLGWVALALGAALLVWLLVGVRAVWRLDLELRVWAASYLLYLAAVLFPQSSVFRLAFPAVSALWGAAAVPRSFAWRFGVLTACLALQWLWIANMYGEGNRYWLIP